jgi:hypothetical protein
LRIRKPHSQLNRVFTQGGRIVQSQLFSNVVTVCFNGAAADVQAAGNFVVAVSAGHPQQDFEFADAEDFEESLRISAELPAGFFIRGRESGFTVHHGGNGLI